MNKVAAGFLIAAGILVPLGLISGAVQAINNNDTHQIISTPKAEVKVKDADVGANKARVEFSIDRSNMVINSNSSATETYYTAPAYDEQFKDDQFSYTFYGPDDQIILSGEVDYDEKVEAPEAPKNYSNEGKELKFVGWFTAKEGGFRDVTFKIRENMIYYPRYIDEENSTKYEYMDNYLIWLIDMDMYENDKKNLVGSETISLLTYKVREIEIRNEKVLVDDVEVSGSISIEHNDVYLYTGDTIFQQDKTYYVKKNGGYEETSVKVGTSIEKGNYYEKVQNTTFSFSIDKLYRSHKYAVGIQFYYSVNDKTSTLYNKNLQERAEFTTKQK